VCVVQAGVKSHIEHVQVNLGYVSNNMNPNYNLTNPFGIYILKKKKYDLSSMKLAISHDDGDE